MEPINIQIPQGTWNIFHGIWEMIAARGTTEYDLSLSSNKITLTKDDLTLVFEKGKI